MHHLPNLTPRSFSSIFLIKGVLALFLCMCATSFELAVFPLRKQHKFPTDALTLNLYEPRYLQLASWVLNQSLDGKTDRRYFGAFYASGKAQMVRDGVNPIVPMIEAGDVGVVCQVLEHEDAMVPTRDVNYDRRRIRLESVVVGRFVVNEVIRKGYGGEEDLFVVVDADRLDDDWVEVGSVLDGETGSMYEEICDLLFNSSEGTAAEKSAKLREILFDRDDEKSSIPIKCLLTKKDTFYEDETLIENANPSVESILYEWFKENASIEDNVTMNDQFRRSLFSFAITSLMSRKIEEESSNLEMEKILKLTSTKDRLEYILTIINAQFFWRNVYGNLKKFIFE